jgi:hypothetical protein
MGLLSALLRLAGLKAYALVPVVACTSVQTAGYRAKGSSARPQLCVHTLQEDVVGRSLALGEPLCRDARIGAVGSSKALAGEWPFLAKSHISCKATIHLSERLLLSVPKCLYTVIAFCGSKGNSSRQVQVAVSRKTATERYRALPSATEHLWGCRARWINRLHQATFITTECSWSLGWLRRDSFPVGWSPERPSYGPCCNLVTL